MTDREIFERVLFAFRCEGHSLDEIMRMWHLSREDPKPPFNFERAALDPLFRECVESIKPGDQAVVVIRRGGADTVLEGQAVGQFGFAVNSEMTGGDCMALLNQGIVLAYERMKGTPQKP